MLVMNYMNTNLRKYLQNFHNNLTWKERIQITDNIIDALGRIHDDNTIHRDLHSGNILFSQVNQKFYISDLGFCGPADKPLNSIYGNLPYIAPEVISGKKLLVNLIFIVLVFLCGKFHLDNHLLLIMKMILFLRRI